MVIKVDGLAAGKGVLIPENEADARAGMEMIMKNANSAKPAIRLLSKNS